MPESPRIKDINDDALLVRLKAALAEDLGPGDITSRVAIPENKQGKAVFNSREPGVLAGMPVAARVFELVDSNCRLTSHLEDGETFDPGTTLAVVEGPVRAILAAERLALNMVQRLSGVATLTRSYVDTIIGTRAVIVDTRKTTPGWRDLEKYAVRCGGGTNHRMGLWDMVLVKDNHLALTGDGNGPIADLVARYRAEGPDIPIEFEVDTLEQFDRVMEAGVDFILLDNMDAETVREAVKRAADHPSPPLLEASGGVNLDTVRGLAETGVDRISVGKLTHSARAIDIGLDLKID